jgi:outer membrane lipoprotein
MKPNKIKIQIRVLNLLMLGGLAVGLTACATSPRPRQTARKERSVTFAKAMKDPTASQGANVVWGGRITGVIGDPNKGADLILSEIPLYALGKAPVYGVKPHGSFIARSSGSLDPTIFRPGEVITLTGQIIGTTAQLGSKRQTLSPEVQMESVRFWQLRARPDVSEGNTFAADPVFDLTEPDGPTIRWVPYYVPKKGVNPRVRFAQTQNN